MVQFDSPFPKTRKSLRKVLSLRIMMKALLIALAIFGVLFIFVLVGLIGLLGTETKLTLPVPEKAILTVNFDNPLPERRGDEWLYGFSEQPQLSFYETVKALNVAATDDRVKAIAAEVNVSSLGLAQIEELRETIKYFRSKGKKAYVYSTGMGSFGGGTSEYYLAAAFDEIWMQPNTEIGITGISIEVPFLRDVLNKIGIMPEFYARHEYKNAMASLLDSKLSPQYKSEMTKLGGTIFLKFINEVSADRKIETKKMFELVDKAPIRAEDGLDSRLIDIVAFKNDFIDELKRRTGGAELYPLASYAAEIKDNRGKLPVIAFLVLDGEIVEGDVGQNVWQQGVVSSRQTVEQLEEISRLPDLRGLVLRINSPGGSYTASAEIWNAINTLKKKKDIPVVVTMGDYAASGGYFVALAGDYIFAEPLTVTGSIGVLGGKMVLERLWKKLDVHWAGLQFGENAGILSGNRKFSPSEKAAFNRSLDNVYRDFTAQVEKSRKIPAQDMDKLARGRIWQGASAVQNRLVDETGGIGAAFLKVRKLSKPRKGQRFRIVEFPRAKTLPEKISELISGAPRISVQKVIEDSGLPLRQMKLLQRLQYDAVLPPFDIAM